MPTDEAALEQHGLRPTNNPDEHIEIAKRAYTQGWIEIEELERRVGLALEGIAVLADDVPLFDAPAVWVALNGGRTRVRIR